MERKKNIHGILGFLVLIVSQVFMLLGTEPFASWFYYFAWWPYILIVDSTIYKIKKNSLMMNRTGEFFLMLFWSVFIWTSFEAVNLVMKNWYYVNVIPIQPFRWLGYAFAYATVLPGLFETTELLESLGLFKDSSVKPISLDKFWTTSIFIFGVACLFSVFFFPKFCFPLIWGSFTFLLEPVNYRWGGQSILRDWENGTLRKFYLLLTAGLICGILWEFWNFWATTKWIYTVPFFDELKLFEMPLLGFLGFPPFAVECYVIYNFISLFRYQRGWEEDNYRRNREKRVKPWLAGSASLIAIMFCLLTFQAMDGKTVHSYWPDLKELQAIPPEIVQGLTSLGIHTPRELLAKTDSKRGKQELITKLAATERDMNRWIRLIKLAELKGMGTLYANFLDQAGIRNIEDLAKQNPEMLRDKLLAFRMNTPDSTMRVPREAIIRVWVREAKRQVGKDEEQNL